jgi:glutaconyl-CoA/methylmalonyl-CoA decarboxylase subunit gamma
MKLRVKIQNRTYEVEVGDLLARPIKATIDGQVFEVWPEEAASQPAETQSPGAAPAMPAPTAATVQAPVTSGAVLAPIPGVIISIEVKPGDRVEHGTTLCILEAMKMKNAIRATRAGKIGSVQINVGETVRHSQVLMEFADE